jgi:hypothetical protein
MTLHPSGCTKPEEGELLANLFAGALNEVYAWELRNCRSHLSSCPACEAAFPDGQGHIRYLQYRLNRIKVAEIERIANEFLSNKHKILADAAARDVGTGSVTFRPPTRPLTVVQWDLTRTDEEDPEAQVYRLLLTELVRAGSVCKGALGDMHDRAGVTTFKVIDPEITEETETKPAREQCASFIRELPPASQSFLFMAVLAADLFPYALRLNPDGELDFGGLNYSNLYLAIEAAARKLQRDYLNEFPAAQDPVQALAGDSSQKETLDRMAERINLLGLGFDDGVDSLKAGQMEIMRSLAAAPPTAAELEPAIVEMLGQSLYNKLHVKTRRTLQLAEYYFKVIKEADGYAPVVSHCALAFENELHHSFLKRVEPLLAKSSAAGEWPVECEQRKRLLHRGRINERITLGDIGVHLSHEGVRAVAVALGFDTRRILSALEQIRPLRNSAAHQGGTSRAEAQEARLLVIGDSSVLLSFHPQQGS